MVEYNPGAEYRLIDMNSTTNLNKIGIIVYWKSRYGRLHPFQLQPGCAASVKIMFRGRTLMSSRKFVSREIIRNVRNLRKKC